MAIFIIIATVAGGACVDWLVVLVLVLLVALLVVLVGGAYSCWYCIGGRYWTAVLVHLRSCNGSKRWKFSTYRQSANGWQRSSRS